MRGELSALIRKGFVYEEVTKHSSIRAIQKYAPDRGDDGLGGYPSCASLLHILATHRVKVGPLLASSSDDQSIPGDWCTRGYRVRRARSTTSLASFLLQRLRSDLKYCMFYHGHSSVYLSLDGVPVVQSVVLVALLLEELLQNSLQVSTSHVK
jgi:hypothetical protein